MSYELANSEDPDKMGHNSAFHHCLYMAFSSKIKQRQLMLIGAIDVIHVTPGVRPFLAYQISDKIF